MPKKKKTRAEKIQSSYRLKDFSVNVKEVRKRKEIEGFGYLSSEFVRKDLLKTVALSILIVGIELYLASVWK